MTTKKIIFAAALLAGTMTTSWASTTTPPGTTASKTLTPKLTIDKEIVHALNFFTSFQEISIYNCNSYNHTPAWSVIANTNSSTAKIEVLYTGVMAGSVPGIIAYEMLSSSSTLLPKSTKDGETWTKAAGSEVNLIDWGVRGSGNSCSFTVSGTLRITSNAETLCSLDAGTRTETILINLSPE